MFRLHNDSMFIIQPVDHDDPAASEAILRVYEQCNDFLSLGPNPASMSMVQADLEHSRQCGAVFCGIHSAQTGEMIGILDYLPAGYEGDVATASLELLMIAAPWRGMGIGEVVVRWVEDSIRADGRARTIASGVQVNNPSAIRFWQRMGYRIVSGARDMGDGTVAYALEKSVG